MLRDWRTRPPGRTVAAVAALAALAELALATRWTTYSPFLRGALVVFVWVPIAVIWFGRITSEHTAPRLAIWHFVVVPTLALVAIVCAVGSVAERFAVTQSRDELARVAERVMASGEREHGKRRIGWVEIEEVGPIGIESGEIVGARFLTGGLRRQVGLAYLPTGVPTDAGCNSYEHLTHDFYKYVSCM